MSSCLGDDDDKVTGSLLYDGEKYSIHDAKYGHNSFHFSTHGQQEVEVCYLNFYVPDESKRVELIPGEENFWRIDITLDNLGLSASNTEPGEVGGGEISWQRSGYDNFTVSFDIRMKSGKRLQGNCSGKFPVAVVD
ncbi:MAG: hypothetical protein LBV47_04160 [Bacteroidales bacterium]|nr:hypothetical protein [Bacteroidales bacterium]